jgi:hypothetical protein
VRRSVVSGERLDAVRAADELRHDGDATEDEQRAHEPAKAAPNTSAPIRIAALITVMTLSQTIRRFWAMGPPLRGRNVPESGRRIKSIVTVGPCAGFDFAHGGGGQLVKS